jgi:elongation factor P
LEDRRFGLPGSAQAASFRPLSNPRAANPMKIQANTIRPGNVLDHNGRIWNVLKIQLIQPGKGGAFIQVEMRDVKGGNKTNERWRTQDTVERLNVDERECTYLYADGAQLAFMDSENYEQFSLPKDMVGDQAVFLQENMPVTVDTIEGAPAAVHLPQTVTMKIVEADPVVKGQTASSSYKPAVLENGARVMVPPHVESGTRIVVNTEDGSYVERAKD